MARAVQPACMSSTAHRRCVLLGDAVLLRFSTRPLARAVRPARQGHDRTQARRPSQRCRASLCFSTSCSSCRSVGLSEPDCAQARRSVSVMPCRSLIKHKPYSSCCAADLSELDCAQARRPPRRRRASLCLSTRPLARAVRPAHQGYDRSGVLLSDAAPLSALARAL